MKKEQLSVAQHYAAATPEQRREALRKKAEHCMKQFLQGRKIRSK